MYGLLSKTEDGLFEGDERAAIKISPRKKKGRGRPFLPIIFLFSHP